MSQNTERDKHNPGHSLCDNSSSHAGRRPGTQPELLQSTGEGEGTNCLGSSPHKTSSKRGNRERNTSKNNRRRRTLLTSLAAQEVRGTRQQRETTTYARRTQHNSPSAAQKRRVPLSLSRSPLPNKGPSRGEGGVVALPGLASTGRRLPLCPPGFSPPCFFPPSRFWCFLRSKQRRVKSLPGRAHWWGRRDRLCWRAYTMCRLSPGLLT